MPQRPPPDPVLISSIIGETGELLAAMWYSSRFPARIRVAPEEVARSRGHGVEIFRDSHTGEWTLIAVNHPWVEPTDTEENDDRPREHQL